MAHTLEFYTDIFVAYIESEKRLSPNTIIAYKTDFGQFCDFISSSCCLTSVSDVRHTHIRQWIIALMQSSLTPRSINRKLSCLKTYFRLLSKRQLVSVNPMAKVIAPKIAKRLPAVVPERQLHDLFDLLEWGDTYDDVRDKTILEVLYGTGIRRSELLGLTAERLDLNACYIKVLGKGSKERLVPFGRHLAQILRGYLEKRQATFPDTTQLPLFLTQKGQPLSAQHLYNIVKKRLGHVTTQDQRGPHVLRHSFATHLSEHGADLNAIKSLLGHTNLSATQVYTHNSVEKLRAAYAQAHPKSGRKE